LQLPNITDRCMLYTYTTQHTVQEVLKLRRHYNHFMYQALLHCAKNSMNALKNRIQSKAPGAAAQSLSVQFPFAQRPFFEVTRHY
jgi:dynein heavy chain, axonemal